MWITNLFSLTTKNPEEVGMLCKTNKTEYDHLLIFFFYIYSVEKSKDSIVNVSPCQFHEFSIHFIWILVSNKMWQEQQKTSRILFSFTCYTVSQLYWISVGLLMETFLSRFRDVDLLLLPSKHNKDNRNSSLTAFNDSLTLHYWYVYIMYI